MTVEITAAHPVDAGLKDRLKRTSETLLDVLIEGDASIGIHLVDDAEIRKLNRRFRHKDKATNVLSFPAEFEATPPAPLDKGGKMTRPAPLGKGGKMIPSAPFIKGGPRGDDLGEIVISLETAAREADPDEGLESRLTRLVAHGMLHLVGLDHHGKGRAAWNRAEKRLESTLRTKNSDIPTKGLSLVRNES